MYAQISTHEKRDFIKWFLWHYQLKQFEATWILTYLMKHDHLLAQIHFVNEAKYCPRAVILSSDCSDQVPFLFYKGKIITDNPDKLFHDIRLHPDEQLYVQLNFKRSNQHPLYAGILENNPFSPVQRQRIKKDLETSRELFEHLQYDYRVKQLEIKIDEALDQKDKETFLRLTRELKKLQKIKE